ncbi:2Fe-2S iron-sulfur cluster binding domain-containing protein [Shewanella sp. BF02_Schw]|uniref:2Fe-2S iron-sulfur cluster-binding protein n=1 Tax=Shewanella sp. BF02_Schw TaxID=394908 RepID=UPI00177BE9E6|nr:2Fe-2S iron-sulfur cluster-binding protein [Shewanella sp. BF02_Schw]MBO1897691.1 2Fe-2S iron-sulfur cluster binding domain-containing protein [Shewanella sp. BF02_Schw]
MAKIIVVNGKFYPVKDETVLEALERAGVSVYSQCRDGYCGACTCKTSNPEAVVHKKNIIASFDSNTEILACSSNVIEGQTLVLKM